MKPGFVLVCCDEVGCALGGVGTSSGMRGARLPCASVQGSPGIVASIIDQIADMARRKRSATARVSPHHDGDGGSRASPRGPGGIVRRSFTAPSSVVGATTTTSGRRNIKRIASLHPSSVDALREGGTKAHLCVLVHGLGGGPWDWSAVALAFEKDGTCAKDLLIHVSSSNSLLKTFDGIDVCGERLADEIRDIVRSEPGLKYISVVGHSLGGLIARYAIGALFCEETGTMYGLRPRHFATIVSPHLGCDSAHATENAVPFLGWITGIPIVGIGIRQIASLAAAPGASLLYRKTGTQLFLQVRA